MRLNRIDCFLLILFLCNWMAAFSQDSIPAETIRMHQLTVDDGLSQGFIYDGVQDKVEFVWLATISEQGYTYE